MGSPSRGEETPSSACYVSPMWKVQQMQTLQTVAPLQSLLSNKQGEKAIKDAALGEQEKREVAVTDMSVTWDLTRREARKKRALKGKFHCYQFSFRFLENARISLIFKPFWKID